jgi:hypothetical protein
MSFEVEIDPLSAKILSWTAKLDDLGARDWNLYAIALVTTIVLFLVKLTLGKRLGIDWLAFVHALVTGIGGMFCVYLDFRAAEAMTGLPENIRTARCGEPALTSLHRILPPIVMGYSIFDVIAGLSLGWDFLLHGCATFAVFFFFCFHQVPHLLTPMLLMEVSTIFLTLVECELFSPTVSVLNQLSFALSFLLFRVLVVPYIWVGQIRHLLQEESLGTNWCLPGYFNPFTLVMGAVFHPLNFFCKYSYFSNRNRLWYHTGSYHSVLNRVL